MCCIINVNIYQVQPSNEHVHQRSNANIFLDEKDLVMGKSETHVANMLESHLFSQIKGMVDAHGETWAPCTTNVAFAHIIDHVQVQHVPPVPSPPDVTSDYLHCDRQKYTFPFQQYPSHPQSSA